MIDNLSANIKEILNKEMYCAVATSNGSNIHNSMIAFYSEDYDIYFGAFNETLKCRNINTNPFVALVIGPIQYHGKVHVVPYNSPEYNIIIDKYNQKLPQYTYYFDLKDNDLYKIEPLIIWLYCSSKGIMHREKIIFDNNYYQTLNPFEIPDEFEIRK